MSCRDEVRIVPRTERAADVRLEANGAAVNIGNVGCAGGRWWWQHRDGERSSPTALNRNEAATALADYHRAFKSQPPTAPVRRLLFS
jgi:hypothetical protein